MSKRPYRLALLRQWEMLMRLPSGPPGITATELTGFLKGRGFGVSKRTVERDLDHLSLPFSIVCNDISKPYGWYWRNRQEFPSIDIFDAACLILAEDYLKSVLPAPMQGTLAERLTLARNKLIKIPEHALAHQIRESNQPPSATHFDTPIC